MGYVCALRNCKTRALSGLFSFPKDPELKKKWLEKCVLTKSIKPSSTVCLKHFRQCDIRTRKVTRRMCLRKDAIPSRNLKGTPVLQGWEKDFLEELSNNKEMSDKTFVLGSSFNNEMRRNLTVDKLEPTRVSDRITVPRPESPIAGTSRGVIIKKVSIKRKGHFQEPTELSGGGVIIKNVQLKKDPLPPEQFVNIKREANDDPLYINCNIKDEPLEESDVKEEYIEDIEEQLERQVDRHILLFSASTKSSGNYLEFCRDNIYKFLKFQKVSRVLFIPYAQGDHAAFTLMAMKAFMKMGCSFESIHNLADQAKAISDAQAIFVGHGNTFLLLKALHDNKILDLIRERVLYESLPYIGAGCGSTVAGMTIQVSNDMPLVLPSSLKALELVPFNINPHYFHKNESQSYLMETRDIRIHEYLRLPDSHQVLALGQGTFLHIRKDAMTLKGEGEAKLFSTNFMEPRKFQACEDLSYVLSK